ncbi:MAG: helix-turn-helix domain-containing protein [Lachnospiraceae bacterium]|nr:helix-turn-helix domain-containing protein [Lachnospiraceae bacterium]
MQDNIEALMNFGLTRQEARIYILLLTEGALSGYEAAKRIGISRSNAYGALAGLVDKGAAYILEEQAVQYQAVPVKEFCFNKLHFLKEMAEELEQQIPKEVYQNENYITIRGRQHVEDKIRNMLLETKERVYFSVPLEIAALFEDELEKLIAMELKVVLLTEMPEEKADFLRGAVFYYTDHPDQQIRLITDSSYALTGELQDEMHTTCLYSANPNLVKLLKEALANEIKLIAIQNE